MRKVQVGHDVTDEDVRRRYYRSLANLPAATQIADIAVIFDNSQNKRRRSLEFQDGSITWRAEKLPGWLLKALPHLNP
jgi:predicted ABC-type ATPase